MVADDVFLGAQDQRHRLVDDAVAQHQNRLLLAADGARGALLKVDGPAEDLLRVVLERTGGIDFARGLLAPVVHDKVHVHGLLFLAQIPDARREARAIAVQLELAIAVHIAAAQQDLDQLYLTVFGALAARLQTEQRVLCRILNLHEPHLCVLFNVERRAHEQALFRSQRFKHRDGLARGHVDVHHLLAALAGASDLKPLGLTGGGDFLFAQIVGLPPGEGRFVHTQPVPGTGREPVDQNRIVHVQTPFSQCCLSSRAG